ncbi:hypothetical protein V8F06_001546 [Rhypophila decipiens]
MAPLLPGSTPSKSGNTTSQTILRVSHGCRFSGPRLFLGNIKTQLIGELVPSAFLTHHREFSFSPLTSQFHPTTPTKLATMHTTSTTLLITTAAAATCLAAAPAQVTSAPSAKDLNTQLVARGIFENPGARQRVQVSPPNVRPMNDLESQCLYQTYLSLIQNDIPPLTDIDVSNWIATSGNDIQTITHISEVDEMCVTTDNLNLPTSLTSAYSAWHDEFESWKKGFHDEAYSLAEKCGTKIGPVFWMLVATDETDCRTAVSAMFGYTAGVTTTTTASGAGESETGTGAVSSSASRASSGSGPVETAISTATSTSTGAGGTNAAETGGSGSGPQDSGAGSRMAEGGLVVMMAALAGVAGLFVGL